MEDSCCRAAERLVSKMAAVKQQIGIVHDIPPPTDKTLEIRDKLTLVLEVMWFLVLVLPCALLALYRTIFPAKGKSLRGKVVLVTGAGRGLGRGLAQGFAREGCKVAVADINMSNAMTTAVDINDIGGVAKAYFCNVAKVEEIRSLREDITATLGSVDILVNNAGLIYAEGTTEECSETDIRAVMDVNIFSNFWTIREFLPSMKERNSGHIVAIASVASMYGAPRSSVYVASKFAVHGLMEVVRAEVEARPKNEIKTTTVFPYFINTSAQYVRHWDLRFPPISIEEAVDATIAGVKRDEVSVFLPWFLQPLMAMGRVIPRYTLDRFLGILSFRIQPQTKEEIANHPISYIVSDMSKCDEKLC